LSDEVERLGVLSEVNFFSYKSSPGEDGE
jgi:hypothetical protein